MITVNSRKYDGSVWRSWRAELTERRDPLLILVGEFDSPIDHPDLGHIPVGTRSYEYYWLDRWYNVFRFHQPSGELLAFYFNINMPPTFNGESLDYVDLDIDVLVRPDLTYTILDRDDYERNAARFAYPAEVNGRVEETLAEVVESIERRQIAGLPDLFATCGFEPRARG